MVGTKNVDCCLLLETNGVAVLLLYDVFYVKSVLLLAG